MSEKTSACGHPDGANRGTTNPPRLLWLTLICAVATLIFLIRASGSTDLESYGQPTHIGYLLDLMTRGSILVQHDLDNGMMSAPPLHTWVMAPFAAILGFGRWAVILPSFVAVLATAILVFEAGRRRLGDLGAGLSAIAFLLSPATAIAIALAGPDALLALIVATGMLAAVAACLKPESEDSSYLMLWITVALATFTAGLAGALLVVCALLATYRQSGRMTQPAPAGRRLVSGVAVFAGAILVWLIPAGLNHGFAPILPTLASAEALRPSNDWLKPIVALVLRHLPFSLFLLATLWRIARHPAIDGIGKRFERFLATWLLLALLAISLTNPPVSDPTFPLWPAGALLAGNEMARLAQRMGKTKFAGVAVVIGCFLIGATYNAAHSLDVGSFKSSALGRELKLASDVELAAKALQASGVDPQTLIHLDSPRTLQLYLGTFRPRTNPEGLATILASANGPVFVATGASGLEGSGVLELSPITKQIFLWPDDLAPAVRVFSVTP